MNNNTKNGPFMLFIGCSIVLSAGAQLLMKVGMLELNHTGIAYILEKLPAIGTDLLPAAAWVMVGLVFYVSSMLFWLAALSRCELSLAYPLLSLSYVLVYLGAVFWPRLHETVTVSKTTGILFILVGVFLVTRTK